MRLGLWAGLAAWFFVSVAVADLIAYDVADNEPYDSENTFMSGQNGGTGFTPWVELHVGMPGTISRDNPSIRADGLNSWELAGTYAVGRGLAAGLEEGTWTFLARHGAGAGSFCGFTLRTSTATDSFSAGEILRFGVDYSQEFDGTRIYYSTDVGGSYGYLDLGDDDLGDVVLQYSVTWSTVSGAFALGVRNLDSDAFGQTAGSLAMGDSVAMFGIGIFENTLDERIVFDEFEVHSIPEPATAASMVAGALMLVGARRRRA